MMHTDPPAHTRYRGLAQPAFKPSATRSMEPMVHDLAGALVAALPAGGAVDVVHELAEPFPLQVIGALLGMDASDQDKLVAWSNASIPGAGDYTDDERLTLMGEMTVELLGLAAAPRENPTEGLISTLATVEVDGERLTPDELGMFLIQLLVAGNETTRNALSGGLVALAERPDAWARLRSDRALVPLAVEEILRWTTPVISFMRTATRDTVLGGVAVSAGDPLLLLYASANRDEREFGPTSGELDVGRDPNHHLAFGFGTHFCLGAALARMELRIALELLLDRFATVELAGPVSRSGSAVIAGVRSAPMLFAKP
jgi:cytochrome P450